MSLVRGSEYEHIKMHSGATATGNGTPYLPIGVTRGNYNLLTFQVTGLSGDTLVCEGTIDGTNWHTVPSFVLADQSTATSITANGLYRAVVTGLVGVRVRISAYGAGTINVDATLSATGELGSRGGGGGDTSGFLLTSGARVGATAQSQEFTFGTLAPWYDYPLISADYGDHFYDNDSSYPSGWTEVDAPLGTVTDSRFSFWRINGSNGNPSYKYRKQVGFEFESLASNAWQSFVIGPIFFRDGSYTGDINYYFGIYRDNAGAIDEDTFIRTNVWWDSANQLWKARGQYKDGTTQTDGSWFTLPQPPLVQPLYVRVVLRNSPAKICRAYIGTINESTSHLKIVDSTLSGATMGDIWWQIHQTRATGVEDYTFLGAIDVTGDP